MLEDAAAESDCLGFGTDFDADDKDCQGCKEGYSLDYNACKVQYEAKQAQEPPLEEANVDLAQEEAEAEAESEEALPEPEAEVPVEVKSTGSLPSMSSWSRTIEEPPTEPEVKDVLPPVPKKKFRRIETFATLLKQGGCYKPAVFAEIVNRQASKQYKFNVTLMNITQWLKLLVLVGVVEKTEDGKYKFIDKLLGETHDDEA